MKKITQLKNLKAKTILLRCDFNVPIDKKGHISDNSRILKSLKTIKYILKKGGKIVLITHIGRPKGKFNKKESTKNLLKTLKKTIGKKIKYSKEIVGKKADKEKNKLKEGEILLLENLRFDPREEKNDLKFAKELSTNCDIYVNEAFSCSHRKHASTYGISEFLKSYAGFQMIEEINNLNKAFKERKPDVLIIGGAKIDTKIGLLEKFKNKTDYILIGGAIANTFLIAKDLESGKSLIEKDKINEAKKILNSFKKSKTKLILPTDYLTAEKMKENAKTNTRLENAIDKNDIILDIGKKSINEYEKIIASAKKIIFNGPMGLFEIHKFSTGTTKILRAIAKNKKALKIIGGGDSVDALKKAHISQSHFTHISTGGGASLEFLEGKSLPGIEILN